MSDLVERLRKKKYASAKPPYDRYQVNPDGPEAADEIERLQRELAEARRQIDFGIHQSDLSRIGVNARRQAFIEAAEIAEGVGVYPELNVFAGGPEWYRHGKRIAAALRAKAEESGDGRT